MEYNYLDHIEEYEQRIEEATNCFNEDHDPIWLAERANYYAILEKFDLAIADCRKAIEMNPSEDIEPYSVLSAISRNQGKTAEAIAILKQAIEAMENKYEAYLNLADLYAKVKMYSSAIETYLKTLEFEDCYKPDIYNYIGHQYLDQKQYDKALEFYNKSLAECAEYDDGTDALFNIGRTYYDMEDYLTAVKTFTKAIDLNEEDRGIYVERGFAYYKMGEKDKAFRDFKKANELSPEEKERLEKAISEKLIPGFHFDNI